MVLVDFFVAALPGLVMWAPIVNFLVYLGMMEAEQILLNPSNPSFNPQHYNITTRELAVVTSEVMKAVSERYVTHDGSAVSYLALANSDFYLKQFRGPFLQLLRTMDPASLQEVERKAFFINLYNLLTLDAVLRQRPLPDATKDIVQFWRSFSYQVGAHKFTLDDIEHGILRGNRPHPDGSKFFQDGDARAILSLPPDHRVHAALNCGAKSCPPLRFFTSSSLQQELNTAMSELCSRGVTLNADKSLAINSIFLWYRSDFARSEKGMLRWLSTCTIDQDVVKALQGAAKGRINFSYHYNWDLNAVSDIPAGRVRLDVYFESLCSDTKMFFTQQLHPAWQDLQDIMDITFIPFGKAQANPLGDGDYSFVCQHGANECYGNKVQSCVVESLPIHTQMAFLQCMFSKKYPAFTGRECSEEVGVAWEPLQQCADSKEGSRLLYQNGLKTAQLKPRLYFVPTVTIDGHYDRSILRASLLNLKRQICQVYQGPPHQSCL